MEYRDVLSLKMAEAEQKAWESLSEYKFFMFGYHAAQWVLLHQNSQIIQEARPNPFTALVKLAQAKVSEWQKGE